MTLSTLIRKRDFGNTATAISAISAAQQWCDALTVARIATVAVATRQNQKTTTLTAENELAVLWWVKSIGEDDPVMIEDVLDRCRTNLEALTYFLWRAAGGDK